MQGAEASGWGGIHILKHDDDRGPAPRADDQPPDNRGRRWKEMYASDDINDPAPGQQQAVSVSTEAGGSIRHASPDTSRSPKGAGLICPWGVRLDMSGSLVMKPPPECIRKLCALWSLGRGECGLKAVSYTHLTLPTILLV